MPEPTEQGKCLVVVLWIDWYAYHVARFRGLASAPLLKGRVAGLEFVGGVGVHAGLKFTEELPPELPVASMVPNGDWKRTSKWSLARKIWKRLDALSPEIVLVPGYYTIPALASALWAKTHRRTSVLMTESTADDHVRTAWKEQLKGRLIGGLFDWAVAGGSAHVRYLTQLGFDASRIRGFYDVVDNGMFREGTEMLRNEGASSGLTENYFLYVGRLASEKNVTGLVASWIDYRAEGGTWSLVLVGDGPRAEELRRQVAASSYGADVHFAGLKSTPELLPFYAFARCFVLPSVREPWGLVVNEAMASGLPVIVSDRCGCAVDLVKENGYVFGPAHTDALTVCLLEMEALDAEARMQMGRRSFEVIEEYSPARFGAEIAHIASQGKARDEPSAKVRRHGTARLM